jgi:hypothetical protein
VEVILKIEKYMAPRKESCVDGHKESGTVFTDIPTHLQDHTGSTSVTKLQ